MAREGESTIVVMTDAGIHVEMSQAGQQVEVGVGVLVVEGRWMQPIAMIGWYKRLTTEELEDDGHDINKWELLGSRMGLRAARILRKGPWEKAMRWVQTGMGGGEGRETVELGERQVENLASLLPYGLSWWGWERAGAFGHAE